MEKFKQLKVWQKARELIKDVYRCTHSFPPEESFGLVSQMRRAVISIGANIAEGSRKSTVKDRKRFHNIAESSAEELKFYFLICYDLEYLSKEDGILLTDKACEVCRMLYALNKKL